MRYSDIKLTDLDTPEKLSAFCASENLLMREMAEINIKFALNEMVIAYNDTAKFKDEINSDNWYDILLKDKVTFGRSEPNFDPCGYRTLMIFQ